MNGQTRLKLTEALTNLTAAQLRLRTAFDSCTEIEQLNWLESYFCQGGGWSLLQSVSQRIAKEIEAIPAKAPSTEELKTDGKQR